MRKAIRNVSPARAIRTLVSMILGSILSVSTPPAREKKMIAAAGRPFTIPTQSLESVISSTSHPMTIVNIWAPINVQPIAQAKVAKVPDTQANGTVGLPTERCARSGSGNLNRGISGIAALIEGMIVLSETGARDEQTTPP